MEKRIKMRKIKKLQSLVWFLVTPLLIIVAFSISFNFAYNDYENLRKILDFIRFMGYFSFWLLFAITLIACLIVAIISLFNEENN